MKRIPSKVKHFPSSLFCLRIHAHHQVISRNITGSYMQYKLHLCINLLSKAVITVYVFLSRFKRLCNSYYVFLK